ncbi:MAG: carboxynorspermidine decarboxylase [Candidatus Omnitrophota bacterium]
MNCQTPYYLIDEKKLLKNLKVIRSIRERSGARSVLALKCFSAWSVFGLMKKYMDGTTASSPFEARLGHEKFGKETHVYCVAFSRQDLLSVRPFAGTVIFNSVSQLERFSGEVRGLKVGLRVNPGFSYSHFGLADPCRRYSRLGVRGARDLARALPLISGALFHFNCENGDFDNFSRNLSRIARVYGPWLEKLEWVSLGGGLYFTKEGYPVGDFCAALKRFSDRFGLQIYLEPGEASVTGAAELVTTVLDIVKREGKNIAIVDASTEAHMLDLLVYREQADLAKNGGRHEYVIAGRSCLAGDVFGAYAFGAPLKVGGTVRFSDAAGYTMVKKNWFNGLQMPSIVVKRLSGRLDVVRRFSYQDFKSSLS